jgi:hypothetical protein
MKFKTFRAIAIAAGGAASLAVVLFVAKGCSSGDDKHGPTSSPPAQTAAAPTPGGATPPAAGQQPAAGGASQPMRPMDQAILDRVHQGISGDKLKDAFPGQAYKVNLYAEGGTAANRVKIDLDRDEKWDEKWSISTEGGQEQVKRQVAPNDDESYTLEYRLRAGAWVKKE